ncbi:hypothetical protein DY000_02014811 [Brassica cretica]|uniref:Uncharacterized protein n=1 Tax=Brassica cretica TaxID=69181 RepID=A0ABQ7CNL9_BRACR|nr:hypothetical protein DY000_02014811 [Brassica cretica]
MSDEDDKLKIHIHYGGIFSSEGNYVDGEIATNMVVDPDLLTFSIFEDFSKGEQDVEKLSLVSEVGRTEIFEQDDGENADVEDGSDKEVSEEESDGEHREEVEKSDEEVIEEEHNEDGVQSEEEDQILGEGGDDPRFGNLFGTVESKSHKVLEEDTQPNSDADESVDDNPNPSRKRRTSLSQPSSTAPQPQASSTAPQPQAQSQPTLQHAQCQPTSSKAPGRGRGRGRRGRPPERGQARKVTVPRGQGVYMCPFTDRVFECFGSTARECGGSSSKETKSRK